MKRTGYASTLNFLLLISWALGTNCFTNPTLFQRSSSPSYSLLHSSNDGTLPERPELISESVFVDAIETVNDELAKANGIPHVKHVETDVQYAIGRLHATVGVPPGIDLVETPNLVLINGLNQEACNAGIKTLDTIVGVSIGNGAFEQSTMGMDMDSMVSVIRESILFAKQNGIPDITFELNRLVMGYYGKE